LDQDASHSTALAVLHATLGPPGTVDLAAGCNNQKNYVGGHMHCFVVKIIPDLNRKVYFPFLARHGLFQTKGFFLTQTKIALQVQCSLQTLGKNFSNIVL
jgi:hypothetical protein